MSCAIELETAIAALDRVGAPYSLTMLEDGSMVIRGERLRSTVPGVAPGTLPGVGPDAPIVPVDKILVEAFAVAAQLVTARVNAHVFEGSIALGPTHVYSTDGHCILKVPHHCNIPTWVLIPKECLNVVGKAGVPPTHIGYSNTTMTFWYGPDAWLKTNLYAWEYPDVEKILQDGMGNLRWPIYDIHKPSFEAIDKLSPFVAGNRLFVVPGAFKTSNGNDGAKFEIDHGLPTMVLAYDGIRQAALFGNKIRFTDAGHVWSGDLVMGFFEHVV